LDSIEQRGYEQICFPDPDPDPDPTPGLIAFHDPDCPAARVSAGLNVDFGVTYHPGSLQINFVLACRP
jgi:hypothetical protein